MEPTKVIQQQIGAFVIEGADARDRGDTEAATNSLRQALSLYEIYLSTIGADMMPQVIPNDMMAGVYFDYGNLLESRGDVAGACEATRKAVMLEPNEPAFIKQYGRYCLRLGKHEEAAKASQIYLQMVPDAEDASEIQTTINHCLSVLRGEYSDDQPKVTDSGWNSRYNAGVQLFETGNFHRARDVFVSLLSEGDLQPVDEFMCHVSICQCILCARGIPGIKDCIGKLSATEFDEVQEHVFSARKLRSVLSDEDRRQPAVNNSLELQDSIGYWITAFALKRNTTAPSRSDAGHKPGFIGRLFGKKT